jgi:Domain of unknown function (DUF5671)
MPVIRRLYVYTIAFIALGMFLIGAAQLLQVLLETAVEGLGGAVAIGQSPIRQRLSLAIALALIGLAGWTIHWWLASRALSGRDEKSERTSGIRHLYLYAVLLVGGMVGMGAAAGLTHDLLRAFLGGSSRTAVISGAVVDPAVLLVLTTALWAYHARVAGTDRMGQPETGASATLRRWFIYGLSFCSLLALVMGLVNFLETLWLMGAGLLPGAAVPVADTGLFAARIISGGSAIVAALVVWVAAWQWSRAWLAWSDPKDPESASVLRKVYIYFVLAGAVAFTTWAAGLALHQVLRVLLTPERGGLGSTQMIVGLGSALAAVVVFGITWAYHARVLSKEAAVTAEAPRQATIRWFYSYLVAIIGLTALAIGIAGTFATLLDLAFQPLATRPAGWWEDHISLFATLAAVGLPIWLAFWFPIQREMSDAAARRTVVRRIYLFVVFGATVLTLLVAGVFALYQLVRVALGEAWTAGQTTDTLSALSALLVAGLLLVYHLSLLRAQGQISEATTAQPTTPIPETPARERLTGARTSTNGDGRTENVDKAFEYEAQTEAITRLRALVSDLTDRASAAEQTALVANLNAERAKEAREEARRALADAERVQREAEVAAVEPSQ